MDDNTRLNLEALISEREGWIAENKHREHLGQAMTYGEETFNANAIQIRGLIK